MLGELNNELQSAAKPLNPENKGKMNSWDRIMNYKVPSVVVPIMWSLLIGIFIGGILGQIQERRKWKKETISRGYAQYHPTNGVWMWKTNSFLADQ